LIKIFTPLNLRSKFVRGGVGSDCILILGKEILINMKPEFLNILQCPACKTKLTEQQNFLTCTNCGNNFHIVDGIAVLLSQKQISDFFNQESLGKYLSKQYLSERKKFITTSQNFVEGLKEIIAFVKKDDFQKKYAAETCNWNDLNDDEAERANKSTTEILADKAHIREASKILDWPTGTGCFLRTIIDKVKRDAFIVCLDIDFVEITSLKEFLKERGKGENILFVNADARQMPFDTGVFDAVTAWGGFIEVSESPKAVAESFRVLKKRGFFAGDGVLYKENSESMKIAEKLGIDSLANKERIEKCLVDVGFNNIFIESVFDGYDKDDITFESDRAPLPAHGDWYSLVIASGQK